MESFYDLLPSDTRELQLCSELVRHRTTFMLDVLCCVVLCCVFPCVFSFTLWASEYKTNRRQMMVRVESSELAQNTKEERMSSFV